MLNKAKGNIWDLPSYYKLVIPTNVGYNKEGKNVMGRGVALQAAKMYPDLAGRYGEICQLYKGNTGLWVYEKQKEEQHDLILFPVKPFLPGTPWLSWQQPASLDLITESAKSLKWMARSWYEPIALPLVGCGNGGLEREIVLPVLESILNDAQFTLVEL